PQGFPDTSIRNCPDAEPLTEMLCCGMIGGNAAQASLYLWYYELNNAIRRLHPRRPFLSLSRAGAICFRGFVRRLSCCRGPGQLPGKYRCWRIGTISVGLDEPVSPRHCY